MSIEHKKVTVEFYSIVLSSSNRQMPSKLDEFLSGLDTDSIGDDWHDNQITLRDFDGDFEGVEFFYCKSMIPVYEFIASKLGIAVESLGESSIRITNI